MNFTDEYDSTFECQQQGKDHIKYLEGEIETAPVEDLMDYWENLQKAREVNELFTDELVRVVEKSL